MSVFTPKINFSGTGFRSDKPFSIHREVTPAKFTTDNIRKYPESSAFIKNNDIPVAQLNSLDSTFLGKHFIALEKTALKSQVQFRDASSFNKEGVFWDMINKFQTNYNNN